MNAKSTKARIEERRRQVSTLLLSGATYRDMAAALHVSIRTIKTDVDAVLAQTAKETIGNAAKYRHVEVMRLDRLIMAVWPNAVKGNMQAIDRCLKIMERRAKMLGLDAPIGIRLEELTNDELIRLIAELGEEQGLSGSSTGSEEAGHLLSAPIQA